MTQKTQKYWFKRRRMGWGWIPVTWQGWLTVVVFILGPVGFTFIQAFRTPKPELGEVIFCVWLVLVGALINVAFSYAKGPKPHWRWGKKPTDNPDEDF